MYVGVRPKPAMAWPLAAEARTVGLDGDDGAVDVHEIADAQLAAVADVALERGRRAESQCVEQRRRRVAEAGEVVGDREVIVGVDFPAEHGAAIRLEPAVRSHARYASAP